MIVTIFSLVLLLIVVILTFLYLWANYTAKNDRFLTLLPPPGHYKQINSGELTVRIASNIRGKHYDEDADRIVAGDDPSWRNRWMQKFWKWLAGAYWIGPPPSRSVRKFNTERLILTSTKDSIANQTTIQVVQETLMGTKIIPYEADYGLISGMIDTRGTLKARFYSNFRIRINRPILFSSIPEPGKGAIVKTLSSADGALREYCKQKAIEDLQDDDMETETSPFVSKFLNLNQPIPIGGGARRMDNLDDLAGTEIIAVDVLDQGPDEDEETLKALRGIELADLNGKAAEKKALYDYAVKQKEVDGVMYELTNVILPAKAQGVTHVLVAKSIEKSKLTALSVGSGNGLTQVVDVTEKSSPVTPTPPATPPTTPISSPVT